MRRSTRLFALAAAVLVSAFFFLIAAVPSNSGVFGSLGTLTSARDGASAAVLPSGNILVTGGKNSSGALNSAEIVGGSSAASMTTARSGHASVALNDGRVLVVGGLTATNAP